MKIITSSYNSVNDIQMYNAKIFDNKPVHKNRFNQRSESTKKGNRAMFILLIFVHASNITVYVTV